MSIRVLRHTSRVLAENPLGDPHERDLWLYLPPDYDAGTESYPVLWCLAAFTASGAEAVTGTPWSPGLADRMDRLIAEGCPPVIVAFPDCFTRWGGSQYLNSPALGNYEDYLCDELLPFVDAELRTTGAHGLFGKSSGGYGAVRLPMRRPGLFRAAACHSGDLGFAFCYAPWFAATAARIAHCGTLEGWIEEFERREKKHGADFAAMNTFAMAAAYSPDPAEPFGVALPYDAETGELRPEIWARWRANDPVEMVRAEASAHGLRRLSLLFLDCGIRDEFHHHLGLRLFVRRLEEREIPCVVEEFPDGHRSLRYRFEVSVPQLAAALRG